MRAFRGSLGALIGTIGLTVLVGCGPSTSSPADSEAGLKEVEKFHQSDEGQEMQEKMGMMQGKPGDPGVPNIEQMKGGQEGTDPRR